MSQPPKVSTHVHTLRKPRVPEQCRPIKQMSDAELTEYIARTTIDPDRGDEPWTYVDEPTDFSCMSNKDLLAYQAGVPRLFNAERGPHHAAVFEKLQRGNLRSSGSGSSSTEIDARYEHDTAKATASFKRSMLLVIVFAIVVQLALCSMHGDGEGRSGGHSRNYSRGYDRSYSDDRW